MIEPRIYRAAFLPVVLALVVVAFSVGERPAPLAASLAPDAFDGPRAAATLHELDAAHSRRAPGSPGDRALAADVARRLRAAHFTVTRRATSIAAAGTKRTATTVIGERAGFSQRRLVVVADRSVLGASGTAQLSGTAALVELARALTGRRLNRTLELVSTSGDPAGALAAVRAAAGPLDAVLVLGDLAGRRLGAPYVVPWSDGRGLAPLGLRRTVEGALRAETGLRSAGSSTVAQFARLAFPLTLGAQGPLLAGGDPAVLLQASGERGPGDEQAVAAARLAAFGRAALRSLTALDGGRPAAAPGSYLVVARKVVPGWAVRLLVGVLLVPVLVAVIDAFARVRRRREPVTMWLGWTVAGALPFALAALFALILRAAGVIAVAPGEPVAGGVIPIDARGAAALASVGLVLALGWLLGRRLVLRVGRVRGAVGSPGSAAALMLVACSATVAVWAVNPFAAALLVPGLHLWLFAVAPELRLRRGLAVAIVLVAVAPAALLAIYYARQFGWSPAQIPWSALLLAVGGRIGLVTILLGSLLLGCLASALAIVVRAPAVERERVRAAVPVAIRGPGGYAGPGSLGGTQSALRR